MNPRNHLSSRLIPRQAQEPPVPPAETPRPAIDAPYGVGVSQPDGAYADTAGRGKGAEPGAYQDVRPWGPQPGVDAADREAGADEPAEENPIEDIAPPRDAGVPKGDAPTAPRPKVARPGP